MGFAASFAKDEERGQYCRHDEPREHPRIPPARRPTLDNGCSEATERADGEYLASQIELPMRRRFRLDRPTPGNPKARDPDRQVDQENAAPTDQGDQAAAGQRARGQSEAGSGSPDSYGATALLFVGVRVV